MAEFAKLQEMQQRLQHEQEKLLVAQRDLQEQLAAPRAPAAGTPAAVSNGFAGQRMIFGQYESLGFSVGGSATQQGLDLTLGLKDRNIAVVPVIRRGADGRVAQIRSRLTNRPVPGVDPVDEDALSVLGQFDFDSKTTATSVAAGLGKFFSTGSAAQRLSDGFSVALCEGYEAKTKAGDAPKKDK